MPIAGAIDSASACLRTSPIATVISSTVTNSSVPPSKPDIKVENRTLSLSTQLSRPGLVTSRVSEDLSDLSRSDISEPEEVSPQSCIRSGPPCCNSRWSHAGDEVTGFSPSEFAVARLAHTYLTGFPSTIRLNRSVDTDVASLPKRQSERGSSMDDHDVRTKIEDMDGEGHHGRSVQTGVEGSPAASASGSHTPGPGDTSRFEGPPLKRPRGRPRKHPLPSPESQSKIQKGRSKTGCVTCRRRKKKCDETRPQCLNCQKNAVVCEGYPEKIVWKSGRQKAEEARLARAGTQPRELNAMYPGIDSDVDAYIFTHFTDDLSRKLTLNQEEGTPFLELLVPMAIKHQGLMHALLCMAASHLLEKESEQFTERQAYHYRNACRMLRAGLSERLPESFDGADAADRMIDDPTVASTLVLCLDTIYRGDTKGEHRAHLNATKELLAQRSRHSEFNAFLFEFFTYHHVLNEMTSLARHPPLRIHEDLELPRFIYQPEAGVLLGVMDGLFGYISRIIKIRDKIRRRMQDQLKPTVNYQLVTEACVLDTGIRSWLPAQKEDSPQHIAAQLYRQCTWIWLYRTMFPSRPSEKLCTAVDEGLVYLRQLPPDASTQSILLMPLFMLGCAAFLPEQRPDIRRAFGTLKRYSNLGNIEPARQVVERIWQLMDAKDEASWDWETIITGMGLDFLVT